MRKLQSHYYYYSHFVSLLILLLSSCCDFTIFAKAYTFIYAGCSQDKYQPNSPFESNLNSFLSSVAGSSSEALYSAFALGNGTAPPDQSAIYGLYQCRGDLKSIDCANCIKSAATQIGLLCPYSYGSSLQLEGCYIRYEHYDFLGKLDTIVMYKRCSKHVSNDVEFFRRRDDVLADLQGALGYRVSSSGVVQGSAQCTGDLSQTDCFACLSDAVNQLKILCGSTVAAHVFLGKCYAQYWTSGYYDLSFEPDPSQNDDEVAKTVAIVIGIIGGIAVLIVLCSVCGKSAAKK